MPDMSNIEDAMMQGQADFLSWYEDFIAAWDAPLRDTLLAGMWASIDGQTKSNLPQQAVATMNRNFGGMNNGNELR